MRKRKRQFEFPNGVPWGIMLDEMYEGIPLHRDVLLKMINEDRRKCVLCDRLGVSSTALDLKLWHEGIVIEKLGKLIQRLNTGKMTKGQIAARLDCTEAHAGQLVKDMRLPFKDGRSNGR